MSITYAGLSVSVDSGRAIAYKQGKLVGQIGRVEFTGAGYVAYNNQGNPVDGFGRENSLVTAICRTENGALCAVTEFYAKQQQAIEAAKPKTYYSIYEPVVFTDEKHKGQLAVQVKDDTGTLLGFADGRKPSDLIAEWEISDSWAPEQAAQLGRAVADIKSYASLQIVKDGVSRKLCITL